MAAHRILGRDLWMMSAASIALFAAGGALAAEPSPSPKPATTVEVLTVTANKRAESLQKVAASISAVSGATLQQQRLQTYSDIQNVVAGLVAIPGQADFGAVNMRGTYTFVNDSPGVDEPTSVYIDDVATFGHVDRGQRLFDIDRVEVLRGPQGTEFGKNTIGGVISIHTKAPSFTPEVDLQATGGSFGLGEFQGYVTGPVLGDRVAAKLSGYFHRQDGYVNDPTTGGTVGAERTFGIRGQALANVTDKFRVLVGADYFQDDSESPPQTFLGDGPFVASASPFFPALDYPTFFAPTGPDLTLQSNKFKSPRKTFNAFVRADWDLDFATLTSITGYRYNKSRSEKSELGDPVDFFDVIFGANDWGATEELRLVSPGDRRLTWLAGVYLSRDHLQRLTQIGNPGGPLTTFVASGPQQSLATSDAYSASGFAEAGYKFTDWLRLVLGGRVTYDHKTGLIDFTGSLQGGFDDMTISAPQRGNWSAFTPKATLEFTPTKDTLFYATVSRGYVGGGFEASGPGIQPGDQGNGTILTMDQAIAADISILQHPYNPEYATNYELGAKTSWFDNRLTANIDIYREDFKDLQVQVPSVITTASGGVVATVIAGNAGRTRSEGLDLELRAAPTPWLRLGATYSYSDDKYLTTDPGISVAGNHLPFTPKNALNFSAAGEWRQQWGTISAEGDVTFRSKSWSSFDNGNTSPGHFGDVPQVYDRTGIDGLLNASIDFATRDGRWDVRLWARNLTDTRYAGGPVNNYFALAPLFGYTGSFYSLIQWNPPRTFGATLTVHLR
jgi:iron complex outermembrane receptor protein